jgi:hypothetical protein
MDDEFFGRGKKVYSGDGIRHRTKNARSWIRDPMRIFRTYSCGKCDSKIRAKSDWQVN